MKDGYQVVITGLNKKRLRDAKKSLKKELKGEVKTYQEDLSKLGSAKKLYDQLRKDLIQIDVLVNHAGYGMAGSVEKLDFDKEEGMLIYVNCF